MAYGNLCWPSAKTIRIRTNSLAAAWYCNGGHCSAEMQARPQPSQSQIWTPIDKWLKCPAAMAYSRASSRLARFNLLSERRPKAARAGLAVLTGVATSMASIQYWGASSDIWDKGGDIWDIGVCPACPKCENRPATELLLVAYRSGACDAGQRKRCPCVLDITVPELFRHVVASPCPFCGGGRLIRKPWLLRLVNATSSFLDNAVAEPFTHENLASAHWTVVKCFAKPAATATGQRGYFLW